MERKILPFRGRRRTGYPVHDRGFRLFLPFRGQRRTGCPVPDRGFSLFLPFRGTVTANQAIIYHGSLRNSSFRGNIVYFDPSEPFARQLRVEIYIREFREFFKLKSMPYLYLFIEKYKNSSLFKRNFPFCSRS